MCAASPGPSGAIRVLVLSENGPLLMRSIYPHSLQCYLPAREACPSSFAFPPFPHSPSFPSTWSFPLPSFSSLPSPPFSPFPPLPPPPYPPPLPPILPSTFPSLPLLPLFPLLPLLPLPLLLPPPSSLLILSLVGSKCVSCLLLMLLAWCGLLHTSRGDPFVTGVHVCQMCV